MTYQEALNKMCENCESLMAEIKVETKQNESYDIHHCGHVMCPWRTIDNDHCEVYNKLQELVDYNERNIEAIKLKNSYISMQEKRFDEACEILGDYEQCPVGKRGWDDFCPYLDNGKECSECWKEYLTNDK